jgi:hypothetical protein
MFLNRLIENLNAAKDCAEAMATFYRKEGVAAEQSLAPRMARYYAGKERQAMDTASSIRSILNYAQEELEEANASLSS